MKGRFTSGIDINKLAAMPRITPENNIINKKGIFTAIYLLYSNYNVPLR